MKIVKTEILTNEVVLQEDRELYAAYLTVCKAISTVTWPVGSSNFSLNPIKKGNGVKPIKNECMEHLKEHGWRLEFRMDIAQRVRPGPVDAVLKLNDGSFTAVEWETGNISSSHRALNKLAIGVMNSTLKMGLLILPSRTMYTYLTDRVGNFQELSPYFDVWRSLKTKGVLGVIEIEHDEIDETVSLIPKGTDGRALR